MQLAESLRAALRAVPAQRLWVNPDCGLKTRGWPETRAASMNSLFFKDRVCPRTIRAIPERLPEPATLEAAVKLEPAILDCFYVAGTSTGNTIEGNEASWNAEGWRRNANGIDVIAPGNTIARNVVHDNEDDTLFRLDNTAAGVGLVRSSKRHIPPRVERA